MNKILRSTFFLGLFFQLTNAFSQGYDLSNIVWTEKIDIEGELPSAMKVFECETTIYNESQQEKSFSGFYTITDLNSDEIAIRTVLGDEAKYPSQHMAELGDDAYMAINAGYFGGNSSYSLLVNNGEVLADNIRALGRDLGTYYPTRGAIGFMENGEVELGWVYNTTSRSETYFYPQPAPNSTAVAPLEIPSASFPENGKMWEPHMAVGGGPVLVKDGILIENYDPEVFYSDITDSKDTPRTVIGYTEDNHLICMVVDGRQTHSRGLPLVEVAKLMMDLGCVDVMNLDGGGSSAMVVNGQVLNKPSDGKERPVPTVLMITKAPKVLDTENEEVYQENADTGVIESETHTSYGSSASRLLPADSESLVTYSFNGIDSRKYEIYAWFDSDEMNATKVDYVVNRGENLEPISFQVNQSEDKEVGFHFLGTVDLGSNDNLVISSSENEEGKYVVVDAIKLVVVGESKLDISFEGGKTGGIFATDEKVENTVSVSSQNSGISLSELTIYAQREGYTSSSHILTQSIEGFEAQVPFEYVVKAANNKKEYIHVVVTDNLGVVSEGSYLLTARNSEPSIKFTENNKTEITKDHPNFSDFSIDLTLRSASATREVDSLVVKREVDGSELVYDEVKFDGTSLEEQYSFLFSLNETEAVSKFSFEMFDDANYSSEAILTLNVTGNLIVLGSDSSLGDDLKVFPIPFEDELTVSSKNIKLLQAIVYDINGKQLLDFVNTKPSTNMKLDLGKLSKGVFLLKVSSEKGEAVKKIIKK
ncbi:phosphodiester glycosidase family protein [Sediminitomix flava]|uniref:Putative secreted protein (Por secretion system target) n=1 Tax=Sediminitomix flava TaxID=379075 RepID=A0A315ZF86_SEDFL|nr:phosphodiester glycosidase family protein [Sediminitomix flava]PWJ43819.1 putative secreted protein (Por secretion system target) [Sediminitomix flava]